MATPKKPPQRLSPATKLVPKTATKLVPKTKPASAVRTAPTRSAAPDPNHRGKAIAVIMSKYPVGQGDALRALPPFVSADDLVGVEAIVDRTLMPSVAADLLKAAFPQKPAP